MSAFSPPTALAVSVLLVSGASAGQDGLSQEAARLLNLAEVSVQRLDVPVQPEFGATIEVQLEGLPFTLDLVPHSLRAGGYALLEDVGSGELRQVDPGPVRTVRGVVLEDPGSIVSGALLDDGLYAKVMLNSGDMYWIEPLVGRTRGAQFGDHAVYHQADVLSGSGLCGTRMADESGPGVLNPPGGQEPAGAANPVIAEIACDADFQFFNAYGTVVATQNRISLVINTMNTQYEDEVRITHLFTTIIVRTTAGGGGYTSPDPSTLLSQFRSEWMNNQIGVQRDVAQLFTGKNLSGNVIGIAYPSGICSKVLGYNLVQSNFSGNMACSTDLSSHELAHTWSAGHCSCSGFTMNPSITCANTFHDDFTEPNIVAFRDSRNCLDDGLGGDVLFYEDFESGGFSAGGWTVSDTKRCVVKKKASFEGNWGAKLKKGGVGTGACTVGTAETWVEAPTLDTTGYGSVFILVDAHVRNNTLACEFLDVQWWDGSAWVSVAQIEQHSWDLYNIPLPAGAAGNPALRLRLVTNLKGAKERAEFDGFYVVGN
jgi:metallopeptidase family M12-like protein